MNVARLNFSYINSPQEREQAAWLISEVRRAATELGRPVAILQDLSGPKIRTGTVQNGAVRLRTGAELTLTTQEVEGTAERVSTTYPNLPHDVQPGDAILLDDGLIQLQVLAVTATEVRCRVLNDGLLGSHKGINLPGVAISAPSVTEKDKEDLKFGLEHDVDYVAISFVRRPEDVQEVKELIAAVGKEVSVIAKLEKPEAIDSLEEILALAEGVMVARGDLGVEMPLEKVPALQKRIIHRANDWGVLVITATQMLESMRENPRPTRAEASDVANAVFDGTDALMLSAETATGRYPLETVRTMHNIIVEAEETLRHTAAVRRLPLPSETPFPSAISNAACETALELGAKAIIAFTKSGFTARLTSKYHPLTPIFAFTSEERVLRRMSLYWGVTPRLMEPVGSIDEMIVEVERRLLADGTVQPGDVLVILAGAPMNVTGTTNLMKLHRVGG